MRARWAPAAVLLTAVGLLVFSLANPERRIAERNIDRWEATGRIDVYYLADLSADAVPALVQLPLPERQRATAIVQYKLRYGDPWSSANLSRSRARELLYASR